MKRLPALAAVCLVLLAACSATPYEPTAEDKDAYVLSVYRATIRGTGSEATHGSMTDEEILTRAGTSGYSRTVDGGLEVCGELRKGVDEAIEQLRVEELSWAMNDYEGESDAVLAAVTHLCPDMQDRYEEAVAERG